MSLIFTRAVRVANVLTDADSAPTISIIRTDTSATVQASTDMTHDSTGRYSFTLASPVAGVTYRASYSMVINGQTISSSSEQTFSDVIAGIYANADDLSDFYGSANIDAYSDLADADTRDNARIQKFLNYADDWINLAFKQVGRTTPINESADDFSTLTRIAAEWAGAMLAKGRGDLPARASNADAFDAFMDGHIERAQAELQSLVDSWVELNPDLDTEPVVAVQAIVPTREQGCNYPWG